MRRYKTDKSGGTTRYPRRLRNVMLALFLPTCAVAQSWSPERPAHVALMAARTAAPLTEFTTDGCSGGLSAGWELLNQTFPAYTATLRDHPPWEVCCVSHDRAYHDAGGAVTAAASLAARASADRALKACVLRNGEALKGEISQRFEVDPDHVETAYAAIAQAMYLAVRVGGGPCTGLPWRWGYGLPSCYRSNVRPPARD
ncbi:hypothetical protein ACFORG_13025 [Lutimaribacter marinistellae]|uniref:Uncharacterized protein n=1 Tax=Lutimaribacter marinistellae TaxID=1820329 RepID=A0ABV7TJ01_9RHOB